MSPRLFIHRVPVSRQNGAVLAGSRQEMWQVVIPALSCRVEPMSGRDKQTILGHFSIDAYRITWGTDDVRPGDRFAWNGKTFAIVSTQDDTGRGTNKYITATATEVKNR